ncbi:PREDICTED: coiled-coil domain-containing protein 103, partial [Acanthisitta chloris]|uniref:coiled-coil domain-containing protein 103 n=1 Tax=Acanthisitta chloris TaxID=57068 RepID=UPI0004F0FD6E
DIVLAAHLKPLEQRDRLCPRRNVLWNPHAAAAQAPPALAPELPVELDRRPRTSAEFHRNWRRCLQSGAEKYQFLLELGGDALGSIFRADVGFGLLGEFLVVLAENFHPGDRPAVLELLQGLAGTRRFGLNLELLSPSEQHSSRELFQKLQSSNRDCSRQGGREGHLMESPLERESEEEGTVLELMRCYQIS